MSASVSDSPPTSKDERYFKTDHLQKDLGRRSVRGGAATVLAQFVRHFVIGLAATAILARLLTPADFGLLAMVAEPANTPGGSRRMIIGVTAP